MMNKMKLSVFLIVTAPKGWRFKCHSPVSITGQCLLLWSYEFYVIIYSQ